MQNNNTLVSKEEVQKIAMLARLKLDDNEIEYFQTQLRNIMNMIDVIAEVDCDDINSSMNVDSKNIGLMREDKAILENNIDDIFANAPGKTSAISQEIKNFVVPKMVE